MQNNKFLLIQLKFDYDQILDAICFCVNWASLSTHSTLHIPFHRFLFAYDTFRVPIGHMWGPFHANKELQNKNFLKYIRNVKIRNI